MGKRERIEKLESDVNDLEEVQDAIQQQLDSIYKKIACMDERVIRLIKESDLAKEPPLPAIKWTGGSVPSITNHDKSKMVADFPFHRPGNITERE